MRALLHARLFAIGGQVITPVQLVVLAVVLLVTWAIGRWVRRILSSRVLHHLAEGQRYTIARLTQYIVWLIGFAAGLRIVNIDLTALAVVAGALGIGIGFGLQNIVGNFVAGLVLLFERPIAVGDRVTLGGLEGDVVTIDFRSTTVLTNDNIAVIVPNSQFTTQTVINWSYGNPQVRIHVPVGVAYGSDLARVTEALLHVAQKTAGVLDSPEPLVLFNSFGDSSLNFELLVWIDRPEMHFRLRSLLNYGIDAEFRAAGIQIPFPQRDVHVIPPPAAPPDRAA